MSKTIKITAIIHSISARRDGGTRIVIDCGHDSLDGILELTKLNSQGDLCLAIAMVPIKEELEPFDSLEIE